MFKTDAYDLGHYATRKISSEQVPRIMQLHHHSNYRSVDLQRSS